MGILSNSSIDIVLHDTLCSSALSLRPVDRGGIWHLWGRCALISIVYWFNFTHEDTKGTLLVYICWCKLSVFPSALLGVRWYTSSVLRLSGRFCHLKCSQLSGLNN